MNRMVCNWTYHHTPTPSPPPLLLLLLNFLLLLLLLLNFLLLTPPPPPPPPHQCHSPVRCYLTSNWSLVESLDKILARIGSWQVSCQDSWLIFRHYLDKILSRLSREMSRERERKRERSRERERERERTNYRLSCPHSTLTVTGLLT